jgi:hypothetical protein
MMLVPLFDLKFLEELAARVAGTSNRRHWHVLPNMQNEAAEGVDHALQAIMIGWKNPRGNGSNSVAKGLFRSAATTKNPAVSRFGEVAEWSIAPHSKCGIRVTVSGVRIPPSPLLRRLLQYRVFDAHERAGCQARARCVMAH